jgi:hypothetical protein
MFLVLLRISAVTRTTKMLHSFEGCACYRTQKVLTVNTFLPVLGRVRSLLDPTGARVLTGSTQKSGISQWKDEGVMQQEGGCSLS